MAAAKIVVVGSYNRDLVLSVSALPAPGETCLALGRMTSPGGKGSNQAIQAALCGAKVAMLAAVGEDEAGAEGRALWRKLGVDDAGVVTLADRPTGMALITVDARGENAIVVDAGANLALAPEHVEAASDLLGGCALVVAQLEVPAEAIIRAFEIARAGGATTLLNAAPAPERVDEALLALTDILVVNEGEARALSGRVRPEEAGAALLPRVEKAVVVTRGKAGAILLEPHKAARTFPSHAVEAVDTTGAGDAFIGAFAAEYVRYGRLEPALAWGLAAGALACTKPGAAASFADEGTVRALAAG